MCGEDDRAPPRTHGHTLDGGRLRGADWADVALRADGAGEVPECAHEDGHKWVVGRPVFEPEGAERVPENVAYDTRQCRRCGYHDERDPREHDLRADGGLPEPDFYETPMQCEVCLEDFTAEFDDPEESFSATCPHCGTFYPEVLV